MKRNVIIDCDPGIDDSLAIMTALRMESLNVLGITVVCGNCPVSMGAGNARKVLAHIDRMDVPVFVGADRPLKRDYIDALDTHGSDGLGESFLPDVPGEVQEECALSFLSKTLRASAPCSVIALGPMTNLAQLIQEDPQAFAQIDELVSMGGNYKSHGNCSPVAEYNYWEDPDAAALVYETMAGLGREIHMAGLDVTRKIVLTPELLSYLKEVNPEEGAFVEAITTFYFTFHWKQEHLRGCVINDPLAVAYFADRSLCDGFSAYTQIDTEGLGIGQSIVDAFGFYGRTPNAHVLTTTDPLRFFRLFFRLIAGADEAQLAPLSELVSVQDAEQPPHADNT